MIIFLFIIILMAIFIFELSLCFIKECKGKIFSCISSILISMLVLCICSKLICNNFCITLIVVITYILICLLGKMIFSLIILEKGIKCDQKKFIDILSFESQLIILSPDYIISKLCKDVLWQTKDDERSKLIKGFNFLNLGISFLIVLVLLTTKYITCCSNLSMLCYLKIFLGYRILSRTIEIMISFIKDVSSKDHCSSLNYKDRIRLAFLSILESIILAFGIQLCNIDQCNGLTDAAVNALLTINSLSNKDGKFTCVDICKIFCGLANFSLIGIVISTYVSESSNTRKRTISNVPQLFVIDDKGVRNTLEFSTTDDDHKFVLYLCNEGQCAYIINDKGKYIPFSEINKNDYVIQDELIKENFKLDGDYFKIKYDDLTQKIDIERNDERRNE